MLENNCCYRSEPSFIEAHLSGEFYLNLLEEIINPLIITTNEIDVAGNMIGKKVLVTSNKMELRHTTFFSYYTVAN